MLNNGGDSMESVMYEYHENLVLAAYSDYINTHFKDVSDNQKMEYLSDLCMDGLADPTFESLIVIDYLDKYYETFLEDMEVK